MALTLEFVADIVKMNQRAKYLDKKELRDTDTQTSADCSTWTTKVAGNDYTGFGRHGNSAITVIVPTLDGQQSRLL